MRSSRLILAAALLAVASPMLAVAGAPPPGSTIINAVFSDVERGTIRQYFLKHPDQLQAPDHLHAGASSAGSSGEIERGRQLPPGVLEQARPLPQELERALPPAPRGYERVILGGKVLLVDKGAQVIHDVI